MGDQTPNTSSNSPNNFTTFYTNWLSHHEVLFQQLLNSISSPKNQPHQTLIEQILSHYQIYFTQKLITARRDIFFVLSSPWLTPFERPFLWITDFRPTILFRFISAAVCDLTAEQQANLERIRADTKIRERQLTEAMASLQESMASPGLLGLLRKATRVVDGEVLELEEAMEELKEKVVVVVESADQLRIATVIKVREVLRAAQMERFLAAAVQFQLNMRSTGLRIGSSIPSISETSTPTEPSNPSYRRPSRFSHEYKNM